MGFFNKFISKAKSFFGGSKKSSSSSSSNGSSNSSSNSSSKSSYPSSKSSYSSKSSNKKSSSKSSSSSGGGGNRKIQGAVRPTTDEALFRKTGRSVPKSVSQKSSSQTAKIKRSGGVSVGKVTYHGKAVIPNTGGKTANQLQLELRKQASSQTGKNIGAGMVSGSFKVLSKDQKKAVKKAKTQSLNTSLASSGYGDVAKKNTMDNRAFNSLRDSFQNDSSSKLYSSVDNKNYLNYPSSNSNKKEKKYVVNEKFDKTMDWYVGETGGSKGETLILDKEGKVIAKKNYGWRPSKDKKEDFYGKEEIFLKDVKPDSKFDSYSKKILPKYLEQVPIILKEIIVDTGKGFTQAGMYAIDEFGVIRDIKLKRNSLYLDKSSSPLSLNPLGKVKLKKDSFYVDNKDKSRITNKWEKDSVRGKLKSWSNYDWETNPFKSPEYQMAGITTAFAGTGALAGAGGKAGQVGLIASRGGQAGMVGYQGYHTIKNPTDKNIAMLGLIGSSYLGKGTGNYYNKLKYWTSKEYPFRADKLILTEKGVQLKPDLIRDKSNYKVEIPKSDVKRYILEFTKREDGILGGSRSIEAQGIKLSRYAKEGIEVSDLDILFNSIKETNKKADQLVLELNRKFGKDRFSYTKAKEGSVSNAQITDKSTGNHYDLVSEKVPFTIIDGYKVLKLGKQTYKKGEALRNPERQYRSFDPKERIVKKDFTDFVDIIRKEIKEDIKPDWFLKESAKDYTTYNKNKRKFEVDLEKVSEKHKKIIEDSSLKNKKKVNLEEFTKEIKKKEKYYDPIDQAKIKPYLNEIYKNSRDYYSPENYTTPYPTKYEEYQINTPEEYYLNKEKYKGKDYNNYYPQPYSYYNPYKPRKTRYTPYPKKPNEYARKYKPYPRNENQRVKAWRPIMYDKDGTKIIGDWFNSKKGAENEGFIGTDQSPANRFELQSGFVKRGDVKIGRGASKVISKFMKRGGQYIEKRQFRSSTTPERAFRSSREMRKGKGMDLSPYIWGYK